MIAFSNVPLRRVGVAAALALLAPALGGPPLSAQTLKCVQVTSSGSTNCTDPGGVASTCSSVKCPAQMTLTGSGGACDAGGTKIKSLFPNVSDGSVTIMCEKQGVDPEAIAVCCQLQ
jgi:hypothetical protein